MTKQNILSSIATFLFILVLSQSCIESDKSTGATLLPGDHILKVQSTSFDLKVQMKSSDSLQTNYPDYLTVGSINDPQFGPMLASAAFRFTPSSKGHNFGENPVAISLKMFLTVSQKDFLQKEDEFAPQNFKLYKLLKDIDSTVIYNNSLHPSDIAPTSLVKSGNVYFGADTMVIELTKEYAQELVSASAAEMDSLSLYYKKFKGLFLTTDKKSQGDKGGRINLINPTDIYFLLSYRHKESSKGIDKDSTISYFVYSSEPSLNIYNHSSKGLEESSPTSTIYLEGMAGIKPYIDFSQVKSQIELWAREKNIDPNKLIVAKAEVRLPFEYPSNYLELDQFPTQVFFCTRSKKSAGIIYDPLSDLSATTGNGNINRSLRYYSLDISSYLQKVIKGNQSPSNLQTYITPIYQTSDYYTGNVYYHVQNYLYSKATLNGNTSDRKPKLVLTYAILP